MVGGTRAAAALSAVLDHRLGQLQRLTGLPLVFAGPVRRTAVVRPQLVIERLHGNRTGALSGLAVEPGRGLGGLALLHARPFVVADYGSSPRITHHFDHQVVHAEGIRSTFAFPVVVRGHVEVVLYGAIGDTALRAAQSVSGLIAADLARRTVAPSPDGPVLTNEQALAELEAVAGRLQDPALRARLLDAHRSLTRAAAPVAGEGLSPLSPRETECLALAALGATNLDIAEQLGLAPGTVKTYMRSLMRKLEVGNRTAAVHAARTAGWL